MTTTNNERQKTYRQKAKANNKYRINTFVDTDAGVSLSCLSRYYAVTKREILEKLLIEAQQKALKEIADKYPDDKDQDKAMNAFFGVDD